MLINKVIFIYMSIFKEWTCSSSLIHQQFSSSHTRTPLIIAITQLEQYDIFPNTKMARGSSITTYQIHISEPTFSAIHWLTQSISLKPVLWFTSQIKKVSQYKFKQTRSRILTPRRMYDSSFSDEGRKDTKIKMSFRYKYPFKRKTNL